MIASHTSRRSASLERNARAPAASALNTTALSTYALRITTRVSSSSRATADAILIPSSPGILMSSTATSGRSHANVGERRWSVLCLADQLEFRALLDTPGETVTKQRMIVRDQDSDASGGRHVTYVTPFARVGSLLARARRRCAMRAQVPNASAIVRVTTATVLRALPRSASRRSPGAKPPSPSIRTPQRSNVRSICARSGTASSRTNRVGTGGSPQRQPLADRERRRFPADARRAAPRPVACLRISDIASSPSSVTATSVSAGCAMIARSRPRRYCSCESASSTVETPIASHAADPCAPRRVSPSPDRRAAAQEAAPVDRPSVRSTRPSRGRATHAPPARPPRPAGSGAHARRCNPHPVAGDRFLDLMR